MSRYVVVGAGAVGAVVAGQLTLAGHDVVLVARGEHLARLRADGLTIARPDRRDHVPVPVVAGPEDLTLTHDDVLVLATKAQDVEAALSGWAWQPVLDSAGQPALLGSDLPVVTLQNGLDAERSALRRFAEVYGATVAISSTYVRHGEVASPSEPVVGVIWLGAYPTGRGAHQDRIVADLRSAGFRVHDVEDVQAWKAWKVLGNVLNGLDVLEGTDEERALLSALLTAEARAVLTASGLAPASLPPGPDGAVDLGLTNREVPGYERHSSTWQSFARGASSEVDHLNGEIVLRGRLAGVPTPVNTALQQVLGRTAAEGSRPGRRTLAEVVALAGLEAPPADDVSLDAPTPSLAR